jgi:hypothetical protein
MPTGYTEQRDALTKEAKQSKRSWPESGNRWHRFLLVHPAHPATGRCGRSGCAKPHATGCRPSRPRSTPATARTYPSPAPSPASWPRSRPDPATLAPTTASAQPLPAPWCRSPGCAQKCQFGTQLRQPRGSWVADTIRRFLSCPAVESLREARVSPGSACRAMGWPRCDCLRGRRAGADRPRTIRRLEATACDTVHAVLGGDRAASVLDGDDQITWATAMRIATDLACVVADGYSVNRRIAPKQ